MINPVTETIIAACFANVGIVIIGELIGSIFEAINRPATILPQANRLIGLITVLLFSLIGDNGFDRG